MQLQQDSAIRELGRIDDAVRGNAANALSMAQAFVDAHPSNPDGLIFLGRAHQVRAQFSEALDAAERAIAIAPEHPVARLLLIDALYRCGRSEVAYSEAKSLEASKKFDPMILQQIGSFYTQTNHHADAARCYERVRVLQPTIATIVYSLASAYIALNEMDKAEALFNGLLRRDPYEYDVYYNRSTLRKQTAESNHVAEMERALEGSLQSETAEPVLCFSLAKELEDLKEWKRSFSYLKQGANVRRRSMVYNAEADIAMLDDIARQFDRPFFEESRPGYTEKSPIFVLGMPRSGTTLVDRILSSHSEVGSVGESGELSVTVVRQAGGVDTEGQGKIVTRLAREFDYVALGREYCQSVEGLLPGYPRLLDKTPVNFYYIGIIAAALPNAKIVHLRRNPVDNCYAIYKTLFRSGYSYSYSLEEMARYYLAYLRLMAHWRSILPGRFLDVDYEDLVDNQEEVSRRMVAHCGLAWEDACLSFEKNTSPSLTASAGQVRQPIYKSSVQLWRRYEEELQPLIRILTEAGVAID